MLKITTDSSRFVDSLGRERIFCGINLVDKEEYREGKVAHSASDCEALFAEFSARGFDLLRLGTTWSAVEPEPGKYNEPLLDSLCSMLDMCEKYGIYAFIDMHQDLYSGFGRAIGDGAPAWAVLTDGRRYRRPKFVWAEGYFFGRAVHRAFDNFWKNKKYKGKGLQDYYGEMWKHVADRVKDKPALFGFDLLNEPFPGSDGGKVFRKLIRKLARVTLVDRRINGAVLISDAFSAKRRMRVLDQYDAHLFRKITSAGDRLIKKFDTERYSPFLNRIASAVREATDNGIIFAENCYYSNLGIPCSIPEITVDGKREKEQCFAPHGYDLMVDTDAYKYASNDRVGSIFAEHRRTQNRLSVPVIVGEWGGFSSGRDWFPHVEFLLNTFDRYHWSNTYWAYFGGLLDEPLLDEVLHRPHPKAVTGRIIDYHFDKSAGTFTLTYIQDRAYDAPTEIYLHKPPKSVVATGEYSTESVGDKGTILKVRTETGENTVTVTF